MGKLFSRNYFFIVGILVGAFLFRVVWLGTLPKGLHADEASFLLNTISFINSGKDEDNHRFPLWLTSYIDSKPAFYSYLQLPFVKVLGPTTEASRLPSALFGSISIALTYWISLFFLKKKTAQLVALLLIVSPWHLVISRSTQEVIVAFTFALVAIGAYLELKRSVRGLPSLLWLIMFLVTSVLAAYLYNSYKVFLPALLIGWTIIETGDKKNLKQLRSLKNVILANILLLILIACMTFAIPQSLERFNSIGILHDQGPLLIAAEQVRRATGITPLLLLRFFYNKIVTYGLSVLQYYLQHFSLNFLFLSGGQPLRYAVPFHGLFYLVELLLVPLGLFLSWHQPRNRKWALCVTWWLLVSPIAAALTYQEMPSVVRSFPMVVPLLVYISVALTWLWERKKEKLVISGLALIVLGYIWGLLYFGQQFLVQQAQYQPWNRNVSEEKLAQKLVVLESKYELIEVGAVKDIYAYLVMAQPSLLTQLQGSYPARKQDRFSLGVFNIIPKGCGTFKYPHKQSVLYVMTSGCSFPKGYRIIDTIRFDDNAEVYDLIEYDPALAEIETIRNRDK